MYYTLLAIQPVRCRKFRREFRRRDDVMRRRRCIKSLLSIESSACTASDLSRRCLAERSAYTCITNLLPSRRYYARLHDIRERIASALEGSGRRFVACNGHVHPLSLASPPLYMTARPLYTLIARIRWPASNPIVLFEREIWRGPREEESRSESFEDPLLYEKSTGGNVVAFPSPHPSRRCPLCIYRRMMYSVHTIKSRGLFPGFCDRLPRHGEKLSATRNQTGSRRIWRESPSPVEDIVFLLPFAIIFSTKFLCPYTNIENFLPFASVHKTCLYLFDRLIVIKNLHTL